MSGTDQARDTTVAERARADAEVQRLQRAEYERNRQPDRGQRIVAYQVGEILGIEIDPLTVSDDGWEHPYYHYSVEVLGLRFAGRFMSDTNGLHRIAVGYTATRLVPRRWFGTRVEVRTDVTRLADLDGWF